MPRIAMGVEYDGASFSGWQKQTGLTTVQGRLEESLAKIAAHPIQLFCAGRTDAGVHAIGQVVHFDTTANRPLKAWSLGTNTHLPPTIRVRWAQAVDDNFHARFKATGRAYRYIIYNQKIPSAIFAKKVSFWHHHLDIQCMASAARYLLGEQDFSAFRSAQCQSQSTKRNVYQLTVTRQTSFVIIDISANAFLHHMVRNIAGVLLDIGSGMKEPEWARTVLQSKDRRQASITAAPWGLYLVRVTYPPPYLFETAPISLGLE